ETRYQKPPGAVSGSARTDELLDHGRNHSKAPPLVVRRGFGARHSGRRVVQCGGVPSYITSLQLQLPQPGIIAMLLLASLGWGVRTRSDDPAPLRDGDGPPSRKMG